MRLVSAPDLAALFTFPELVEHLRAAFAKGAVAPVRHHHAVAIPGERAATLLLMPAWDDMAAAGARDAAYLGVKVVTVHPDNARRGKPSVTGVYILMDARTGAPLALFDGLALTLWRTAAASALAASYLARPDARRLVMVGAGALAPHLIAAHASLRPIDDVAIWNHRPERAESLAAALAGKSYSVRAVTNLQEAVQDADIVSCATLSAAPLVRGEWLKPGAHLDLVGAFTPAMRESDDAAVRRSSVFVDTRAGALAEAGDLAQPIAAGVLSAAAIRGELAELCRGDVPGRRAEDEITLFKSVGAALEDLAAAALAFSKL